LANTATSPTGFSFSSKTKLRARSLLQHSPDTDRSFLKQISDIAAEASQAYKQFNLRRAAQLVMQIAQTGNVYFDERKPWSLVKTPETYPQMEATLYCCLDCLKTLALVSSPIIPEAAQKLWEMLGYTSTLSQENWDQVISKEIPKGRLLPQPQVLFKRVEDVLIQEQENKLKSLAKNT
jgi:methionyl-tRNA synthetase